MHEGLSNEVIGWHQQYRHNHLFHGKNKHPNPDIYE
jgi:hypothetical protein